MSPTPKVTVLLPVRNGSAHLSASLASIFAQSFSDFELLVIDNCSTDSTPELLRAVRDPRLRVITNPRDLGLVASLNIGLAAARADLVARQDHDDISHPERLQKQVRFLAAHPDHVLVGTEALQTDARGRTAFRLLRPRTAETIRWYLCFDNPFIHSSVMFRREIVLREFGGYVPSYNSEDYNLWARLARQHPMANLAEPLLRYREHGSSMTGSMSPANAVAFDDATAGIRSASLHALLGHEADPADVRVLSTYRRNFDAQSAANFLAVFEQLVARASANMEDTAEFQRVQGIQLAELAYRLLPIARSTAAALFRRAILFYPELVTLLPWPRMAALFLLGDNARQLFLALTRRR